MSVDAVCQHRPHSDVGVGGVAMEGRKGVRQRHPIYPAVLPEVCGAAISHFNNGDAAVDRVVSIYELGRN